MADIDSSLPIRTELPGDVVAKIADATTPSQQLAVAADGSISAIVSATNLDIRDLSAATDSVSAQIKDTAGNSLTSTAGSLNVNITNATVTVSATDLDIRDLSAAQDNVAISDGTDTLAINADGSINVNVTAAANDAVNDYNTASVTSTSNHDYAVTAGKTLHLNQIEASASGEAKIEVQIESGVATNSFATRFVQFNSTADTNMSIHIENPILVAAGV